MLYAGLDLCRKRLDFHLLDGEGATVEVGAAAPDADGLRGLTRRLDRHGAPIRAAIESMNGARFVHDQQARLATLLLDLLTPEEDATDERTAQLRFDIALLAERLIVAVDWLREREDTAALPIGCFGASTGAAAALIAAAERPRAVGAVVSRGGRPDLAEDALERVDAPTLLIVGGLDTVVVELNEQALRRLATATKRLEIIPRATHLFPEPGALEQVAQRARDWFIEHLSSG
jgi:pimeloyl-ACP methyl ester carboxylesterase